MTPPSVHRPRSKARDQAGDLDSPWRTSSFSLANGNCVEVSSGRSRGIGVRDSMDQAGPVLRFTSAEWRAFLGRMRKR